MNKKDAQCIAHALKEGIELAPRIRTALETAVERDPSAITSLFDNILHPHAKRCQHAGKTLAHTYRPQKRTVIRTLAVMSAITLAFFAGKYQPERVRTETIHVRYEPDACGTIHDYFTLLSHYAHHIGKSPPNEYRKAYIAHLMAGTDRTIQPDEARAWFSSLYHEIKTRGIETPALIRDTSLPTGIRATLSGLTNDSLDTLTREEWFDLTSRLQQ